MGVLGLVAVNEIKTRNLLSGFNGLPVQLILNKNLKYAMVVKMLSVEAKEST
jgi:hypothetical protein